ncbi:hypothetical protein [Marinicellulosiphila megalodicopiae]|uniref:hypothetical protein n=1 Tax=Marinicellulosiphila megalodicopiae TaxID=2724896 RepID=UPI003BB11080
MKITEIRKAVFNCLDALPRTDNLKAVRHALQDEIDIEELPYFVATVDGSNIEPKEDQHLGNTKTEYAALIQLVYVLPYQDDLIELRDQIDTMIIFGTNEIKNNLELNALLTESITADPSLIETEYEGRIYSGTRDLYISFEE